MGFDKADWKKGMQQVIQQYLPEVKSSGLKNVMHQGENTIYWECVTGTYPASQEATPLLVP